MASPTLSSSGNGGIAATYKKDRKMSIDGYTSNVFDGKAGQMAQVAAFIAEKGFLPQELIETEVAWFYKYFMMEGVDTVSNHIMSLYAAKMQAFTKKNDQAYFNINLEQESDNGAVYIHNSRPGVSMTDGPNFERRIDERYLTGNNAYRMVSFVREEEKSFKFLQESYRSSGQVSAAIKTQLRCYFVAKCDFVCPNPTAQEARDITQVSDRTFLSKASPNTLEVYNRIMLQALECTGPVIEAFDVESSAKEKRIVIGYRQGSVENFFSSMSDLYHYYELYSTRKYVENFANGVTLMTLYLSPLPDSSSRVPMEHSITQILKEASLIFCVPQTPLQALFQTGQLSIQEAIYGYAALIFCQHFLNRLGSEYTTLTALLDPNNAQHVEVLLKLKKRLRQETFTREYVLEIVRSYPELIRQLYIHFAMVHYTSSTSGLDLKPSLSYQRIQKDKVLTDEELAERIKKTVCNQHELMVFESMLAFNRHILKTNFYQPYKVALSFRLDPAFLPASEYPQRPFGMFLVIGAEFRGFHVRFRDVARGGIRIIRSRNREAYSINLRSLFDENYALAATQQRKNKDIPEGGSKGTILLDVSCQDKAQHAFEKYVDAILDLLLVGQSDECNCINPGKIVDKYGKREILFFGPDEGTADFMDWASQHARRRGASFWKAFTTGKSQSLGGIPHDLFGMTTRSIHQYVTGIYAKLGLTESSVTKFQTGGPDGDLGSNEIKISSDRTVAIVDGSGVIYDPMGLDRSELLQLAQKRQMICNFSTNKLSPGGFRVLIDERNVQLPGGEVVEDGLKFRNEFHLHPLSAADLFVPCGGRPEAVDINNVQQLFMRDEQDMMVPRFKYVVEGANLFFTQEARIRLEGAGVIIFKDASANKGGVTSSSLEVLAALAFTDAEFSQHMQVSGGIVPEFYQEYIKAVHATIERNAQLEFECLWREFERCNEQRPRSVLSDELSLAIVKLNEELQHSSSLYDNRPLRLLVLSEALPVLLQERIGLEELVDVRLPENYVRACFGSYLASRFIYQYGIQPSQFAFFEFMSERYFSRL